MRKNWVLLPGFMVLASPVLPADDLEKLLDQRIKQESIVKSEQEQVAIAKGKREAALAEGKAVADHVNELSVAVERWEKQISDILTSPEGAVISNDPQKVEHFIELKNASRIQRSQVEGLRTQINTLMAPLENNTNNLYAPSESLLRELRGIDKRSRDGLAEYDKLQSKWRVLTRPEVTAGIASQGKSSPPPVKASQDAPVVKGSDGPPTVKLGGSSPGTSGETGPLTKAIEQLQTDKSKKEWEEEQAIRSKVQAEEKKRVDEETARREREIYNQKVERLKQEQESIRQKTQLNNEQAEKDRLHKEASSPATIQRFAPFLAKSNHVLKEPNGHVSLERGPVKNGYWPKASNESAPLSYTAISEWGALANVNTFVIIATTHWNPRPKGAFRPISSEKDRQDMQRLLGEFNRYAEAWVEMKILDP